MGDKIRTETPDFRTYEPEVLDNGDGTWVGLQLCEEFIGGRWEAFISTPVRAAASQAEAERRMGAWLAHVERRA